MVAGKETVGLYITKEVYWDFMKGLAVYLTESIK
jgi:hypothetical protein